MNVPTEVKANVTRVKRAIAGGLVVEGAKQGGEAIIAEAVKRLTGFESGLDAGSMEALKTSLRDLFGDPARRAASVPLAKDWVRSSLTKWLRR